MRCLHLALIALVSQVCMPAMAQQVAPAPKLASFVNVCKNDRGVFDRRACGGKQDPRRAALA
ncbi:MAG: hypothetical protein EOO40_03040 [Deltaproteobacteria bacterium]|nr:MAG: hypothetical protein EOO40_03040 [Deltaproteobacteria bacterium]